MKELIRLEGLRKVYLLGTEKVVALNRIDLTIGDGEICCILGTSGSGKSTLLNLLAGLEKPSRGSIRIGKYEITKLSEKKLARFRRKFVGFVFQSYNLMGSMTALENVALPLAFRGVSKGKREKLAAQMLRQVGLGKRLTHRPTQMSGGQQQRVGIARAFVSKPRIVFADEPTGNLDTKTTVEIMELMVRMARKNHQTLIIVTHDGEIAEYADRIIHIVDGAILSDQQNPRPKVREEEPEGEQKNKGQDQKAAAEAQKQRSSASEVQKQQSSDHQGKDPRSFAPSPPLVTSAVTGKQAPMEGTPKQRAGEGPENIENQNRNG